MLRRSTTPNYGVLRGRENADVIEAPREVFSFENSTLDLPTSHGRLSLARSGSAARRRITAVRLDPYRPPHLGGEGSGHGEEKGVRRRRDRPRSCRAPA